MRGHFQFHLALFVVQLMYGINYVVAKGLMNNVVGPNGFILIRGLGAVALFWLVLSFKYEKVNKKDLGRLAICGLFGVAVNQTLFFNGLMRTSPINAPIIMTTTPILVLILSAIVLKEKVKFLQVLGVLIGAIGSIFFILQNSADGFASGEGDILILLNATSYAFYLVLVKPLMSKYRPITVITWVFTFGLIYVLIWAPSSKEVAEVNWSALSSSELFAILFVVVGVTFVPYLLNVFAMKQLSPAIAAVYIYLQPILSTLFVILFSLWGLQDYTGDLSASKIICAFLVFIGVYLVIRPQDLQRLFKTKKA
ncbi:DMT family transporter [Paracrocinitomix mangrovi]|uniref:DMT family transporter n=1 Tax=Paracrocinitomix mangrovi TaxID=2862509 RepID=UPI001C8DC541|nr:DMT family transporter [Paracrocinitomix mangrovi]UKN00618.1 DMT family transporter [Paracrocinitomix mangrovi]